MPVHPPRRTVRHLLVVALVVALTYCSATASNATLEGPGRAGDAPVAASRQTGSSCTRPAPTTAAGWEASFDRLGGRFAVGDQSTSLLLPDGRTLWLLDDTIQGSLTRSGGVEGWRMLHNTIAITDRGCTTIHAGARAGSVIPDAPNGEYYWPQSAVVDGGSLYVFSMRMKAHRGSFAGRGMELAEMRYAPGGVPSFARMHRTPASGTRETAVQWGVSTTIAGRFIYVYGTRKVRKPYVFGKALYVARVPRGRLTELSAWRYWDGTSWGTGEAQEIHPAAGGVSTSVSAHRMAGRWVVVAKKDDFLGQDAIALTGPTPAGPFTEHRLAPAPSDFDTGDVTYSVMAHPHLGLRSGRLLISVSRNNLDPDKVLADVERARPYFVEVTLPAPERTPASHPGATAAY